MADVQNKPANVPRKKKFRDRGIETCKKKSQFLTREKAEHYATKLGELHDKQFKVYVCTFCTMFHLTTVVKQEKEEILDVPSDP